MIVSLPAEIIGFSKEDNFFSEATSVGTRITGSPPNLIPTGSVFPEETLVVAKSGRYISNLFAAYFFGNEKYASLFSSRSRVVFAHNMNRNSPLFLFLHAAPSIFGGRFNCFVMDES